LPLAEHAIAEAEDLPLKSFDERKHRPLIAGQTMADELNEVATDAWSHERLSIGNTAGSVAGFKKSGWNAAANSNEAGSGVSKLQQVAFYTTVH
jgi:hypothetical protein